MIATALAELTGQSELGSAADQATLNGQPRPLVAAMQGEPARKRGHERTREVEVVGVKRRQRKPWKPGNRDHEIYVWVRFQGMGQAWVASQYEISQATVSRTLQRYEKWQAHAQPGEDGTLDHAERMRAQRWLTYERNERILGSCLRMAGDMEFPKDTWKSVTRRPGLPTSGEQEIRTESSMLDRSGMAARFLQLAFRINMEQLKLTEQEPLEPLPPLTEEQNAALEAESSALWTEPDEAQRQREENEAMRHRIDSEVAAAVAQEVERRLGPRPGSEKAETQAERKEAADGTRMDTDGSEASTDTEVGPDQTLTLKLHKVHNCIAAESGASADCDETYAANGAVEEMLGICMHNTGRDQSEPGPTDSDRCPADQ